MIPIWLLCAAILPAVVQAQYQYPTSRGTIYYEITNRTITIIGYTGSDVALTIPSKIGPRTVTSIGDNVFASVPMFSVNIPNSIKSIGAAAFSGSYLTNVTIPNSVTSIGPHAFDNCTFLTSATIGDGVTSIGDYAFHYCIRLTSITIPNSVTNFGDWTFWYCYSLTNVTIGDGITSIGDNTFNNCFELTSVTIGNRVTSIGDDAFYECGALINVTIPNSVTSIGDEAFSNCYDLTNVTIGNRVTSIGEDAFTTCTFLTSVMIPESVTSIGDDAFADCYSLNAITVDALNSHFSSVSGVLFDKSQKTLIQYPPAKGGVSYTIPNSVTNIGDHAFYICLSLTNITIPSSVTSIGSYGFAYCYSLTGVYCEGNAPSGDWSVFWGDTATVYYLPGTTGWGATFDGCPTALWLPQVQTGGAGFGVQSNRFGFNINWANGQIVVVEACTNLTNPVWQPIQTNTLTGGSSYFSDPQWTNYPSHFYRLRSP